MIDPQIRQIQLKCLEILDIVHDICTRNGIKYSLCGGSVVGAHLYKRCLPWDDDIDIMMTRDNYNRFCGLLSSSLPEGFSVLNYQVSDNFVMGITKIINDRTTYVQGDGQVFGVFLDITVYDRVPINFLKHIDMFLVKRSFTVLRGKLPGNGIKNRLRNVFIDVLFPN
ncbi:MAG: LicD family protein, partial [Aeriscardovia sp.]|nr:LicD family protein [Aeriscardovia sp.]